MESILTDRLAALSHPQRLSVFRLLMRRYPDALPAGEIASVLSLKPSTASVYLSTLTQTGLILQRRDGTRLLYTVNLEAARAIVSDLFVDCCRGRADLCPPLPWSAAVSPRSLTDPTLSVLFVCTGNSARSIMAETLLRDMAGDRFTAYSAGTARRSSLNPFAVELLCAKGHDVATLRSKTLAEFQGPDAPRLDFVLTVCDRAANQDCPSWPGPPVSGHWGLPDPARAEGTDTAKRAAFQQTYQALRDRIGAFIALPFDQLDRGALQRRVDTINLDTTQQD